MDSALHEAWFWIALMLCALAAYLIEKFDRP
jgi:hypothetical protein